MKKGNAVSRCCIVSYTTPCTIVSQYVTVKRGIHVAKQYSLLLQIPIDNKIRTQKMAITNPATIINKCKDSIPLNLFFSCPEVGTIVEGIAGETVVFAVAVAGELDDDVVETGILLLVKVMPMLTNPDISEFGLYASSVHGVL